MSTSLVWPTLALAGLTFGVWLVLSQQRLAQVRRHPPTAANFANSAAVQRYFSSAEKPTRNLANLFEMPVLYFALVPMLMLTGHVTLTQVVLAWTFVGLRGLHSVIHIGHNRIRDRARAYLASCVVLAAMWIVWLVDLTLASQGTFG
ncbi:MAPEG family protein [Asticcacaulis sp.]|uniref:MAPEG family protein n=1 Tax=Asticcacaulis sp. TaxID=1872648 RepID=UPI00260619F0|nr:MAPEG family protein [Asticcacaulis sp.]